MHSPTSPSAPKFDGERLARQTYLTADEAAFYLGYTAEKYGTAVRAYRAFHALVTRHSIHRGYTGRRLLFRRRDLDRFVSTGATA